MTIQELITKLREYPPQWEVMLGVQGEETFSIEVWSEQGGASAWVKLWDGIEVKEPWYTDIPK